MRGGGEVGEWMKRIGRMDGERKEGNHLSVLKYWRKIDKYC